MAIAIFTFMTSLDSSIVNIAMPVIAKSQNQSVSIVEWIIFIYLLVITSLLMLFGRLGDQIGKVRVFKWGTILFVLGSLLAGLDVSFLFLLVSRAVQALGAAMTMSNNFGIATALFPPQQRGRALAILATAFALGAIAGPSLGGLILGIASWQYIFWINVPVGLIAIWFGHRTLPKSTPRQGQVRLDYVGTITFAAFISLLFFALSRGQNVGYARLDVFGELIGSISLLIIFLIYEHHSAAPMLNFKIFHHVEFSLGIFSAVLVFIVGYFYNIIVPYYLVNARHFSPSLAGILMATIPVTIAFFGPLGGTLADKFGGAKITIIGLGALLVAQGLLAFLGLTTSLILFVSISVVYGIGMGLFQSPNNAVIMSSVDRQELGIAGSLNALARNLGMMLGTSLSTLILFTTMSFHVGHRLVSYPVGHDSWFILGMKNAFIWALILTVIAELITIYRFMHIRHKNNKMS